MSSLSLLPKRILVHLFKSEMARRIIANPTSLRSIRLESLAIWILWATVGFCYGERWPLGLAIFIARGIQVSVMNNAYHYGSPMGGVLHGYNFYLPRLVSWTWLHFPIHSVHHRYPRLPWTALPRVMALENERFDAHLARAVLRQFKGPIQPDQLPKAGTSSRADSTEGLPCIR